MATDVIRTEPTLVLFALEREAKPFRRLARGRANVRIAVCGVGRSAAESAIVARLAEASFARVVMAGFCGGLRDGLAVGDVRAARAVVDEEGGRWACQASVHDSVLLTAKSMIGDPAEKRRLAVQYGAALVDMESAAVADVCERAGVPFLAVRAVSDTVDTRLSPELLQLLAGGTVSIPRVCVALLRKPALLKEFLRLGRDTRLAARNLANELLQILDSFQSPGTAVPGLAAISVSPPRSSPAFAAPRSLS